jgi:hypothetical protein
MCSIVGARDALGNLAGGRAKSPTNLRMKNVSQANRTSAIMSELMSGS